MRLLFELSGEHPSLPAAEAEAVAGMLGPRFKRLELEPGVLVLDIPDGREFPSGRLAFTHAVHRHILSCPIGGLEDAVGEWLEKSDDVPHEGSVRVRVSGFGKARTTARKQEIEKALGGVLTRRYKIDLRDPRLKLRVLLSDNAHMGAVLWVQEKPPIEKRKPKYRPFFSPISLGPKLARAMVNLSGAGPGSTVLDPFCGTGGILIEAGIMGLRVMGSDLDWKMVEGCMRNLEHFGTMDAKVLRADIGEVALAMGERPPDAVVTDLPYGRASGTGGEKVAGIYERLFRTAASLLGPGKRLVLAVHDPGLLPNEKQFRLLQSFECRVHKSLTRHLMVFEKL